MKFSVAGVQCEVGVAVIEYRVVPCGRHVTTFALGTVPSLVIILTLVTTEAGAFQAVHEIFARVTILAIQAAMPVGQGEAGLYEVIETDALPR